MKKKNATEIIYQKITNGINNLESKLIKNDTKEINPPKKTKSLYDNVLDNIEKNNK